jgi:hypothetical protein
MKSEIKGNSIQKPSVEHRTLRFVDAMAAAFLPFFRRPKRLLRRDQWRSYERLQNVELKAERRKANAPIGTLPPSEVDYSGEFRVTPSDPWLTRISGQCSGS